MDIASVWGRPLRFCWLPRSECPSARLTVSLEVSSLLVGCAREITWTGASCGKSSSDGASPCRSLQDAVPQLWRCFRSLFKLKYLRRITKGDTLYNPPSVTALTIQKFMDRLTHCYCYISKTRIQKFISERLSLKAPLEVETCLSVYFRAKCHNRLSTSRPAWH